MTIEAGGGKARVVLRVVFLDEELPRAHVHVIPEERRVAAAAVAASPADLLVVGLEGARDLEVDDGLDVRPVDAHAEGVGRADDPGGSVREGVLDARALGLRQARVVGLGRETGRAERLGRSFGALAGPA